MSYKPNADEIKDAIRYSNAVQDSLKEYMSELFVPLMYAAMEDGSVVYGECGNYGTFGEFAICGLSEDAHGVQHHGIGWVDLLVIMGDNNANGDRCWIRVNDPKLFETYRAYAQSKVEEPDEQKILDLLLNCSYNLSITGVATFKLSDRKLKVWVDGDGEYVYVYDSLRDALYAVVLTDTQIKEFITGMLNTQYGDYYAMAEEDDNGSSVTTVLNKAYAELAVDRDDD